ncbi:MAG: sel1 repeat family protein [Firmicutes bacterium]|nr:sel1 repeat family protein [Bacillota bacterium]
MNIEEIKRRAEAGDAAAQEELGAAYEMGEGVSKDIEKAYSWTKKSAEQGYAKGQFYLGMAYFQGEGENNYAKAAYWFFKSALQQYSEGGTSAGGCFFLALESANIAVLIDLAQNDDARTWLELGREILKQGNRDGLSLVMRAADSGHAKAQSLLGTYYQDGRHGLSVNFSKAFSLYEKAAAQDDINGIMNYASCFDTYYRQMGVTKDYDKSIELYKKAERLGGGENARKFIKDATNLKKLSAFTDGFDFYKAKDYKNAVSQLTVAIDLGHLDAYNPLGMIYLEGGYGIESNFEKAVQYMERGMGKKEAYEYIGIVHLEGDGVKVNLEIAVEYLEKALALGKKEVKKPLKIAKKSLKKQKKG